MANGLPEVRTGNAQLTATRLIINSDSGGMIFCRIRPIGQGKDWLEKVGCENLSAFFDIKEPFCGGKRNRASDSPASKKTSFQ